MAESNGPSIINGREKLSGTSSKFENSKRPACFRKRMKPGWLNYNLTPPFLLLLAPPVCHPIASTDAQILLSTPSISCFGAYSLGLRVCVLLRLVALSVVDFHFISRSGLSDCNPNRCVSCTVIFPQSTRIWGRFSTPRSTLMTLTSTGKLWCLLFFIHCRFSW